MHLHTLDGTHLGIGDIILPIGTHGDHISGTIITVIIHIGIHIIMGTIITVIIIVILCIKTTIIAETVRSLLRLKVIEKMGVIIKPIQSQVREKRESWHSHKKIRIAHALHSQHQAV